MNQPVDEPIRVDDLKVGDTVFTKETCRRGWCYVFRYKFYREHTIARITPKRTKVVMKSGREFDTRHTDFYQPNPAYDEINEIVLRAMNIPKLLTYMSNSMGWFKKMPDYDIRKLFDLIAQAWGMMEDYKDET